MPPLPSPLAIAAATDSDYGAWSFVTLALVTAAITKLTTPTSNSIYAIGCADVRVTLQPPQPWQRSDGTSYHLSRVDTS